LTRGYLSSRTATQYMVQRVTESKARLEVREGSATGQPPEVANHLQTGIRLLVLRDSRGQLWLVEGLDSEASATLTATTDKAAADLLAKFLAKDPPGFPRDYDPELHTNSAISIFMPNYGAWYNVDTASSMPVMATSLLETNLAAAIDPAQQLAPGRYLAVTETSTVVPYGVPRVREEASLHMIRGRY
jgi:hypothetical protein